MKIVKAKFKKIPLPTIGTNGRKSSGSFLGIGSKPNPYARTEKFQKQEAKRQEHEDRERESLRKAQDKRQQTLKDLRYTAQVQKTKAQIGEYKGRQRRAKRMGRRRIKGAREWWQ